MGLELPEVGVTDQNDWAIDLNAALTIIDSHDHSDGHGCKILTGSVSPKAKGSTASIKILMAYGFEVFESNENQIYFKKDI